MAINLIYSDHARRRMKQRSITELQVEYILQHPTYVKKSFEGRKEAVGMVERRIIKIVYFEKEKYLKLITIM